MTDPILGGDVTAHKQFNDPLVMAAVVEEARIEQEQICGYALIVKGTRQTHYKNEQDHDVYEVWATFAPAPPPPPPEPLDGTQA